MSNKTDPKKTNKNLNEAQVKLSWAGKLFFSGAAAYIAGKGMKKMKLPIKVRGNSKQMQAVIAAIANSKKFQDEINKPGATVDKVIDKLKLRNLSKKRFREITGKPWPI